MDSFEDAKLRVKEATDLVALIESYLPLKPRGREFVALCPFHPEKTPSFCVIPDGQFYHCFGCGKSGDAFTFLMEREGLTFRAAMETLAERARISLEGVFGRSEAPARRGPDPHQVLGEVRSFFQQALLGPQGALARDYLAQRGLGPAIEPWALGYHPYEAGALRAFAQQRGLSPQILDEAGLLRGGREPFAGRVIFPIEDERGRVVAFGGRIVPGGPGSESDGDYRPAKYINSPESPFFQKRGLLFGLQRCKQAGARRLVVVEGYTDVIACHLAGFHGTVAALGTAFTSEHARKIERYATEGVVLLFDGDRAGQQAAERALRELVNSRLVVKIALMSGAKDPAEVVVGHPDEDADLVTERRARFADLLDGADDALAVWFRLLRERLDFGQAVQLEAAARECAALLGHVDSELQRQALLQQMARHLAVPSPMLERLVKRVAARHGPGPAGTTGGRAARPDAPAPAAPSDRPGAAPPAPPAGRPTPTVVAEHELLACILAQPPLLEQLGGGGSDAGGPFESPVVQELLGMVRDAAALGRLAGPEVLRYLFTRCAERADLRAVLAVAAQRKDRIADPAAFLSAVQRGRQRRAGQQDARSLRVQLQAALAAGDQQTADLLTQQLVERLRRDQPRAHAD